MKHRFKKEDIGKRVLLDLDPKKHKLAKALGADEVKVYGEIVDMAKDYVKILKIGRRSYRRQVKYNSPEKIPYSLINSYKFIKYIKNTSKPKRRIINTGKAKRKIKLEDYLI